MFIGRQRQLEQLSELLQRAATMDDDKPGQAILIRGRRRVGKSRLVEQFISSAGVPYIFFAADGHSMQADLRRFADEVAASNLPNAEAIAGAAPSNWRAALQALNVALPDDGTCIVAIDEMPNLIAHASGFEGALQNIFDRQLSRKRLLLIGIGSDLAMMEQINSYNRPFYQRATEMVVPAMSPLEVAEMLGLPPHDAFDAFLVSGGLPLILSEWPRGATVWTYLKKALKNPTSALLVSAERSMAAEFPRDVQAREVLAAIGGRGERTFTAISQSCGITAAAVSRAREILSTKRLVVAQRPLSTTPSKETRYTVADPYLRFWLTFIAPNMQRIERGSVEPVLANIKKSWDSWRGRAIEPVIYESLARMELTYGGEDIPGVVGGFWTRTNSTEVDIVVANKAPVADAIYAVGSIKWREGGPFDEADLAQLIAQRPRVPGACADTPLVIVSRNGSTATTSPGSRVVGPEELLNAWR
jgi:hypothetical protein